MNDEILAQKIKFACQLLVMLKVIVVAFPLMTAAGICFALYQGRPLAALMGWLAGFAATGFMLFIFLHLHSWLADNEHKIGRVNEPTGD
jgi:hypothetical protein